MKLDGHPVETRGWHVSAKLCRLLETLAGQAGVQVPDSLTGSGKQNSSYTTASQGERACRIYAVSFRKVFVKSGSPVAWPRVSISNVLPSLDKREPGPCPDVPKHYLCLRFPFFPRSPCNSELSVILWVVLIVHLVQELQPQICFPPERSETEVSDGSYTWGIKGKNAYYFKEQFDYLNKNGLLLKAAVDVLCPGIGLEASTVNFNTLTSWYIQEEGEIHGVDSSAYPKYLWGKAMISLVGVEYF